MRSKASNNIKKFLRDNMAWAILFVICIVFSFISPNFFSITNTINILNQNAYIIIASLGIAFVMLSGQVDLSVGYALSLNGVVSALLLTKLNMSPWIVIIMSILFGILLSIINMMLSYKMKLQLMMTTIGTMAIFQGLSYVLTQSKTISGFPKGYKVLGQGYIGPFPIPVIIAFLLVVIVSFILNKTYIGRYVFALGGNEEAARLAGINIFGMKMFIAIFSGAMVGLASSILCARLGSIQANSGAGLEFTIITAVLLGGVSVRGGEGKISGVVAGVLILAILSNGMQLAGLDVYYQFIAKGIIMLAAIGFDVYQLNRRNIIKDTKESKES